MPFDTVSELAKFGAARAEILFLRPDSSTSIPYLDLLPSLRRPLWQGQLLPEAIVEGPFGPLAYIVRSDQLIGDHGNDELQIRQLQRRLAFRGEGCMLAILGPEKLRVLPLGAGCHSVPITEVPAQYLAPSFFRELAIGSLPSVLLGKPGWHQTNWGNSTALARLIVTTAQRLSKSAREGLLLTVRAIVIRYLKDNGLVAPVEQRELANIFRHRVVNAAIEVNRWLDRCFRGEILKIWPWSYEAEFGRTPDIERPKRWMDVEKILKDIIEPSHPCAIVDGWNLIDFSSLRPIVIAEACEQAIVMLETASRRRFHYTQSAITKFLVEEAMSSQQFESPTVLATSTDCGQILVETLKHLVILEWDRTSRRPSLENIIQLTGRLHGISMNPLHRSVAAATLALAAIELSAEAHPLSNKPFPSLEGIFAENQDVHEIFDIVVGDHAGDTDYGREAIEYAAARGCRHSTLGLCVGSRVVRRDGARLPRIFRDRIRLTGLVANVKRPDRTYTSDMFFAWNGPTTCDSKFWLAGPFHHPQPAPSIVAWIDASRTQPVSQSLAMEIPGLLAALPKLNVLEAGVLIKLWQTLASVPQVLVAEDPIAIRHYADLISNSIAGKFARAALGGKSAGSRIRLPTVALNGLSAHLIEVAKNFSRESTAALQEPFLAEICGLDAADVRIIERYLGEEPEQTLSIQQFSKELEDRLKPFYDDELKVLPLIEESAPGFHLFCISRSQEPNLSDLNWFAVHERLADLPASSRCIVPTDYGFSLLWIFGEHLRSSTAWIATLDILCHQTATIRMETAHG